MMQILRVLSLGTFGDFDWCGYSTSALKDCKSLFTKDGYRPLAYISDAYYRALDAFIDTLCDKSSRKSKHSYTQTYTLVTSFIAFLYERHNDEVSDYDNAKQWVREYWSLNYPHDKQ